MPGSSLAPALLVAMPQLLDPNFRRAVVLLVHNDSEGTFGVVLNRPTEITALGLCASLELDWRGDAEQEIGWGGPVQPQTGWIVYAGAQIPADGEAREIGAGVHFAGSLDVLRQLAEHPPEELRLLLGYAGWGPGQLESELTEGAWIVAPLRREVVFEVEPSAMWDHVLRGLGIDPSTLVASRGIH